METAADAEEKPNASHMLSMEVREYGLVAHSYARLPWARGLQIAVAGWGRGGVVTVEWNKAEVDLKCAWSSDRSLRGEKRRQEQQRD